MKKIVIYVKDGKGPMGEPKNNGVANGEANLSKLW